MRARRFLAAAALILMMSAAACSATAPDVRHMTVAQATTAIRTAGFKVGQVTYDEKATETAGSIISQTAQAGASIALVVASKAPTPAPCLIGLDANKAKAAVTAAGLTLGAVTESYDASASAGTVVAQTPAPGADAAEGSSVGIVVSRGPQPVAVPSVVGKTKADATSALVAAGFKVKSANRNDKARKGTVVAQKPASGEAQPGTTVILTVSTGVTYVIVPDMWTYVRQYPGLDETTRKSAIEAFVNKRIAALGLRLRIRYVPDTKPDGWPQEPRAGTRVRRGTVVVLPIIS